MRLSKLYITPDALFDLVEFHSGINIIAGVKQKEDKDSSLNGIGKSLLLDLIDFALLSFFNSNDSSRLAQAYKKSKLKRQSINLEFKVGNKNYKITRSFKHPNEAHLFINKKPYAEKSVAKLRPVLAQIIFSRDDYDGVFHDSWLSQLLKFYLKIQQVADERFTNPVKYTNRPEAVVYQYLFYLLNLNNELLYQSITVNKEINELAKSQSTTEKFVLSTFRFQSIAEAKNEVQKLNNKIRRLKTTINKLHLDDEYKATEKELNEVTAQLKNLIFLNRSAERRFLELDTLASNTNRVNTEHVEEVYNQFAEDSDLAPFIKKSLDEAKEFRTLLYDSRKDFFRIESDRLKRDIKKREESIRVLMEKQKDLLKMLDSEKALDDLTTAYEKLSKLESERNQIESKIDLFSGIDKEIRNMKLRDSEINIEFDDYIDSIQIELNLLREIMFDLYMNIFGHVDFDSLFSVERTSGDEKIKISVIPDDKYSHGKNQGRTIVFDLALLFKSIKQGYNAPKFLIHDGIFDSLDDDHFISLYEYCIKKLQEGYDFQYIVTLKENRYHDDLFGASKLVNKKRIDEDTIIEISAKEKLLGEEF
jgi:uncharacterized protein YydD (DUF2326 family)